MIPRPYIRFSDIKRLTPTALDWYRSYYCLENVSKQGRRGARTSRQIKKDLPIKNRCKIFCWETEETEIGGRYGHSRGDVDDLWGDREIASMLHASARGRRKSLSTLHIK